LTILCVGEDPNLLAYRALLLRSIGASVKVTSGAAAPTIIKREEFSLIIVGHAVGDESARIVYEAAKARTPCPIVLRLNHRGILPLNRMRRSIPMLFRVRTLPPFFARLLSCSNRDQKWSLNRMSSRLAKN
jgi:hypothetical protein